MKKFTEKINESNSENSISSAKEFLKNKLSPLKFLLLEDNGVLDVEKIMIEFAKFHVKEALQSAADNYGGEGPTYLVEETILNAYPENNIK